MSDDLETAWSGATGWTDPAKGRYLAVPTLDPPKSKEQIAEECRAAAPRRELAPYQRKDDIVGTLAERIYHQVASTWISSNTIAKRLGLESRDRSGYQNLTRALRSLWMQGLLERKNFTGSGYHRFGTLMYRRKEAK